MALTDKQVLFAKEYLVDLNATQAAIRAGYSVNSAKEIGCENLSKPNVAELIASMMAERSKRTEITADMVLREYAKLGFSNITDYLKVEEREIAVGVDEKTNAVRLETVQTVRLFDSDAVDRTKMDAVAEIKQTRDGIALKLHDKKGALDSIARHLGMFNDKLTVEGKVVHFDGEDTLED